MRTFDLAPLYRSTVGFDRLFSLLDQVGGFDGATQSYPPYNIERTGENAYRITVAVAGFTEKDLSLEVKESTLTIRGVSREVTLPVTSLGTAKDPWGNLKAGFETETTINRKDYGLAWNATLETGGFLVGDDVKVSLSIQAVVAQL